MHEFHQLTATALDGKTINFSDFEGKVVLIVNTASECGFTKQYESLQTLHSKHAKSGLVIIGFPQLAASRRPFGRPSLYEGKIPT